MDYYTEKFTIFIILFIFNLKLITNGAILENCECGIGNGGLQNRIVGGVDTLPNEYPWVAGIFDVNDDIYCGGSIISDRHILTAGHCVYYTDPFSMYAVLGMHDRIRRDGLRFNFVEVFLHPKFTSHQFHDSYDIAIIKVGRAIIFSDVIRPVCLPKAEKNYDLMRVTVAGWGRMWSGGKNSRYLQETKVIVEPTEKCATTRVGFLLEPDVMLCAYAKKADACQGDSGGALFLEKAFNRFEQMGIISFGIGCGTENSPGIYTKVTPFLDWIHKVTSDSNTCLD